MQITDHDLEILSSQLYARRAEGVIVPRIPVSNPPMRQNQCHDNVDSWVRANPSDQHVFGYLFFDLVSIMGYVQFRPHSVVETEQGRLMDITPVPPGAGTYPFIRHVGSYDLFAAAGMAMGLVFIPPASP